MAKGKRNRNRRTRRGDGPGELARKAEALNVPVERLRQGDIDRPREQIADVHGMIGAPGRSVDTLDCMLRRGTITPGMRDAGRAFHADFVAGGFVAIKAADMARVPAAGAGSRDPGGAIDAKDRLWRALQTVGGLATPAARVLWDVVGREESLSDWALRSGWNGRPIHKHTAGGLLIAALGAIEAWHQWRARFARAA